MITSFGTFWTVHVHSVSDVDRLAGWIKHRCRITKTTFVERGTRYPLAFCMALKLLWGETPWRMFWVAYWTFMGFLRTLGNSGTECA